MNFAEITSENVRKLLAARHMSLRQISAQIGASPSTLSDAMRSRHGLSIEHLAAIATCSHVTVDALCDPAFDPEASGRLSADDAGYLAAYHSLDAHGRRMVDAVLAIELERLEQRF